VDFSIFPCFVGGDGLSQGEKTVKVSVDVWERLMRLKIEMRARSLDEVVRELFRRAEAS
jgi:predicted CopG family antitoxin